jgi:hypothetical protein
MLKRIPKSDISVRPFKAYKEWNFDNDSTEITVLEAVSGNYSSTGSNILTSGSLSGSIYNKHSVYGQLRAQFYNGYEDNPFLRFGDKTLTYDIVEGTRERFLNNSAKVISIPQIYVGEGIKKGSATLIDGAFAYSDDSHGNLIDLSGDSITVSTLNAQNSVFNFKDIALTEYSASLISANINSGELIVSYNSVSYTMVIQKFDVENGIMIVDNIPFLTGAGSTSKIGNIFYSQGLIVLTRSPEKLLKTQWDLYFKSTETIYEHEYLLIVNESDYNVSTNPTAVSTVGGSYETFIDDYGISKRVYTEQPVKYIKKLTTLENGNILDYRFSGSVSSSVTHDYIKAGFEHYDLSGSVDSTGSFLAPFITTIGLYDDDCDLVAVAKLPKPIKSDPEIPVNFIVRFDT